MRHNINSSFYRIFIWMSIATIPMQLSARENVANSLHRSGDRTTAVSACQPAVSAIDLDINNVKARVMTGGDMWWDIGLQIAAYEVPKGSGHTSQFAASCWIGGYDLNNQLKVAAQTYRQDGNDYWPGALDKTGKINSDVCANWDYFWKVDKSTINEFIQLSKSGGDVSASAYDVIRNWPAVGNTKAKGANSLLTLYSGHTYAPFVDLNGDGKYEPENGEYPNITGDQFIWWVFNDAGNVKLQSQTSAIGVEIQTSAFAYSTQDYLNNATFYNYHVTNYGASELDSTFIAVWDDCDLGWYLDDYIGCDSSRGLGIQYNGTNCDGCSAGNPSDAYGLNPPQVGLDYFKGPLKPTTINGRDTIIQLPMTVFDYYNNDFSVIGNPSNGLQIYHYMTGELLDGEHFRKDYQGPGIPSKGYGSGSLTNYVYTDDPSLQSGWSECACNDNPGDRRFVFSSGPFKLIPGAKNDITFGCIWAPGVGGCPNTNFKTIRSIDDGAQALFDNNFKTIEGPQAPRLVCRELDRQLVFYIINDYGSNNYAENYGRSDGVYNDSLYYHQTVGKAKDISTDTLYHFEGYRVFQLANSQVTPAAIFNQTTGQVDPTQATEVFECDIKNGVSQIVNYSKQVSISDTTWAPQIKVNGKDSSIKHSFVITQDAYPNSTNSDQQLINYHSYYFVAVAYAYNNFAPFQVSNTYSTQDQPYLGSAHGAGGIPIPIITAIPNATNGTLGTKLNCGYGGGVSVTRVEGIGNGGNYEQLTAATEESILAGAPHETIYSPDSSPVTVKIIDPVKVPAYTWVLQILDTGRANPVSGAASWKLLAIENGKVVDTIYSESELSRANEQILEKYGISINIAQVNAPGIDTKTGNGYIGSDLTFENPNIPWLYGVQDQQDSNLANWLRAGSNQGYSPSLSSTNPCNYNDNLLDPNLAYENLLSNFSLAQSTWAPYVLAAAWTPFKHLSTNGDPCGFEIAFSSSTQTLAAFKTLPDVDLVFTSDTSKWTRCAVIELQEDVSLSENAAQKFFLRNHKSWNKQMDKNGSPVYSSVDSDYGMSWFPGYAINEATGKRLNIVFGEDSYQGNDNGKDMLWNPSANIFNLFDGSIVFGGRHVVYVLGTQYNEDSFFVWNLKHAKSSNNDQLNAYDSAQWIGVPTLNPNIKYLPLSEGLIPTTTRLRFRVNMPYGRYMDADTTTGLMDITPGKATYPYYTFSTVNDAPVVLSDNNTKSTLLSKILAVPNPYYGYSGYESSRLDTKVRITNLPATATIYIYALDGSLIRTLSKSDPNNPFIDWDLRNSAGLMISSGMYLFDVHADGIGETILKWFGAVRPIDVSTY